MRIYNSLSRQIEEFVPLKPPKVGMYTCGPTIYDRKQIGNFRTYVTSDLLYRLLKYNGYEVAYIMNFTDVGHLSGDNAGDADTGEDRMVKAAKRERKTAWEVATMYEQMFLEDFDKLNLARPDKFVKATEHIPEQIELVKRLEDKGLTYKISDGIYFDTVAYEQKTSFIYGELSDIDQTREGTRIEPNPGKKNPRDFALWKFSPKSEKRDMEWPFDSAQGKGMGFPGWHIECSAMSMKYLGEQFDLHVGGQDIKSTHHPNEIAQSQGVTGKRFVKYWVHGGLLMVDGERMATSLNNNYKVPDIEEKGFHPLALRYLYLTAHYHGQLNFTWSALAAAQTALDKLVAVVRSAKTPNSQNSKQISKEKLKKLDQYRSRFWEAASNDLNFPQALAVLWEMLKSNVPDRDKLDLLLDFDTVLGLDLVNVGGVVIPEEVKQLVAQREQLRHSGQFVKADEVRLQVESLGFIIRDTAQGPIISSFNSHS